MKAFSWFLAVAAATSLIVVSLCSTMWWYDFSRNCEDYLKLAGDAPTLERADEFLGKAVGFVEQKGLTGGNSAYIFRTPKNDVGIWYGQLKAAKETTGTLLKKIGENPTSVTQLERDNALMKIREVVLDDSQGGVSVTAPEHIMWFPNQWLIALWWFATMVGLVIGVFLLYAFNDY